MKTKHKVTFLNTVCTIFKDKYLTGGVALELICPDGEPMTTATVNMPCCGLNDGEICIKNYSENEGLLEILEAANIVKATGRKIPSGFVEIPVCKLLI